MEKKFKLLTKSWSSPIPPHLTPEERAEWEKELEWENQELERRKKEGFWKYSKPS